MTQITDTTRIEKVRLAIAAAKRSHDLMQKETAEHLLNDGWMHSDHLERVIQVQATMWVYDSLETVLTACEEEGSPYTLPGTVEALRRRLTYLLATQSLGGSSSEMSNAQDRAKAQALQTIIAIGPLAY